MNIKSILTQFLILNLLLDLIQTLSKSELFFLPDATLFQMGIDQFRKGFQNQLGRCFISDDPHACSHYAGIAYLNGTTNGLPDLIGTGCLNGCWGPPNTYYNYKQSKLPICTGNITTDGANMLRIGIIKGYCGITDNDNYSIAKTNLMDRQTLNNSETMKSQTSNLFWWILGFSVVITILLCVAVILIGCLLYKSKNKIRIPEKSFLESKTQNIIEQSQIQIQ